MVDINISNIINNFFDGVANGDISKIRMMCAVISIGGCRGCDFQNAYGQTGLMIASSHGHLNVVEYLIRREADVNIKDDSGKTALDYAKTPEIREVLIKAGAKSGVKNESFWSKLFK